MVRAGSSQRSYRPHPPSATYSRARQWSAGSSGGWSEACGYRIQVAERLATWATLATSVSMSTYALSIALASSAFSHATL